MLLASTGILIVLALLFPLPAARANPVTARALGMGNAYTGVAEGFHALYWNPAGLAFNGYEISAGMGGLGLTRIGEVLDRFEAGLEQDFPSSLETFAGIRLGQAAIGTAIEIEAERGRANLRWFDWWSIGAGFPLTPPEGWRFLSVGLALRRVTERNVVPGGEGMPLVDQGELLDLGVLAEPSPNLRIGATVRGIWSSFSEPELHERAESRIGLAYRPQGWRAGLRADLSTEGTLSYGVEWPVGEQGALQFRLGQQLAPGDRVMTTAGAGVRLGILQLDVAAGFTSLDPGATRIRADLAVRF